LVGHGGPSTTTFNYANLYEPLLDVALPSIELNQYNFFSATLNKSSSLIRQWIKRSNHQDPSLAVIANQFKQDESLEALIVQFKHPEIKTPSNNNLVSLHYDLVNWSNPASYKFLNELAPTELASLEEKMVKLSFYKGFDPYQIAAHKIRIEGLNLTPIPPDIDAKSVQTVEFIEKFFQLINQVTFKNLENICYKWTRLQSDFYLTNTEEADDLIRFFENLLSDPLNQNISEHNWPIVYSEKKQLTSSVKKSIGGDINPRFSPSYSVLSFKSKTGYNLNHQMSLCLYLLFIYFQLKKGEKSSKLG
jgi:hypothetical protein